MPIIGCKKVLASYNIFKNTGDKLVGNIPSCEWVKHVNNLLNPTLLATSVCYTDPAVTNKFLDADFTLSETEIVLRKVKKAPSFDTILYEFC